MQITYSFRIYPTLEQVAKLNNWLNLCRKLYNLALEERQTRWKTEKKSISYKDQQNKLPAFKKEYPEYKEVHSQVLQDALRRVDTAYKNFFTGRAGYPRFKGRDRYTSVTYPQVDKVSGVFARLTQDVIYLPKLGYVKIRVHRDFDISTAGRINVKLRGNTWYANITCETSVPISTGQSPGSIGIDVGLNIFVATSKGELIDNPRHLKNKEKYLKRIQRRLSRKKKGSKNRDKAKRKLAKHHRKVTDQRKDFLHKVSYKLVKENDTIIAEDLKIKNMTQNHRLAKSIHDAGWGKLLAFVEYKAKKQGKVFLKVPAKGTSQTCICGAEVPKDLSVRVHTCPKCGLVENRDVISAKVIELRGLQLLATA